MPRRSILNLGKPDYADQIFKLGQRMATIESRFSAVESSQAQILARLSALEAGGIPTPTPTPAPVFTQQPTISPTSGTAGTTTFTATPGAVSNGSVTSRAWLLNGTSISAGLTATPQAAGTLTYRETATGTGGTVQSNIVSATVAVDNGGGTPTPTPTAPLSAPTLTLATANTTYPPQFDVGLDDTAQVGDTIRLQWKLGSDDFTSPTGDATNVIDASEANAKAATFTGLSSITTGTNRFRARVERSSGNSPWSNIVTQGPDDVAPVLSALSSQMVNSTSGKVLFSTDTAEGTARTVLTTANTAPSQATMDASMNTLAVTTTGAQQIPVGGLTAATLYYAWVQQADATGNKSPITAAGSFTTDSAVAFSMTEVAAPATQNVNYANTTATFPGLSLGAAQSSRRIVALVMAFSGGGAPTAVTIGGVAATLVPGSQVNWLTAWEATVPNGTTGDVAVTGANNWQAVGVKLMRVIGANGSPSVATLPYGFNNAPFTVPVTTPTGGATGVVAYVETLSGTGVWTNATGQSETDNVFATFASAIRTTAGAANVSVNGYGNQNSSMLAVSYAP